MKRFFRARDYQPDADRDVADEFQSHLELKVEDLLAQGMPSEEAWVEARRTFGHGALAQAESVTQTRGRLRRISLSNRFDTLWQDLRYALRRMTRSPGFTAAAILSLAIGIGANTAVFSVVNAFLIRKAPFRAPEELVRIYTSYPHLTPYRSSAYPDFLSMKALTEVFEEVGASESLITVTRLGDEPRQVLAEAVSAGLLPMLGVDPVLGRSFSDDEDRTPGEGTVAILGYGFWQQAFGGNPDVLGSRLELAGLPFTVIGVLPEWFQASNISGISMDVFVPITMSAILSGGSGRVYEHRGLTQFNLEARLAPGVTVEEARAALDLLAIRLQEAFPDTNQDREYNVIPTSDVLFSPEMDGVFGFTAAFLLAVVGLVLLLACTNLASFLLARGIERRKEVAIRLALGAERPRLVRQLLTETILLGLLGGLTGLLVAGATLRFVMAFQPPFPVPLSLDLGLDQTVLLFTLGVSGLAGLLFGLAPALQTTRPEVAPTLKEAGVTGRHGRFSLQSWLVTFQVTVSMVLLVGGGLFVRSLFAAQNIDPGFSTEDAGIVWIDFGASRISGAEREVARAELERRIRSTPGVSEVAVASHIPLSLGNSFQMFTIPGVDPPPETDGHLLHYESVTPGYFHVMQIPLLSGRSFTPEDVPESPRTVVINQKMAQTYWPGENALGKELFRGQNETPITVVGVVANTKVNRLGEEDMSFLYFPMAQYPSSSLQILVRGPVPQAELVAALRRVVREVNPGLVVMEAKTMTEHISLLLFGPRVAAFLLGLFGALALFLSSIGLYGVVSFSVSRRVREVGIRMSLGANHRQVAGMLVRNAMAMVALGGSLGLGAAYLLARVVQRFLLGVNPGDPLTLILVPTLLGVVAFSAALIPARRATRVNPTEALRTE